MLKGIHYGKNCVIHESNQANMTVVSVRLKARAKEAVTSPTLELPDPLSLPDRDWLRRVLDRVDE